MRRRGTIRIDADLDDVFDEIETADLKDELKRRLRDGDPDAVTTPLPGEFTERDIEDIRYFIARGAAHDLLSVMASCMGTNLTSPVQLAIQAAAKKAEKAARQ